jgi:hypothetical protein
MRWKLHVRFGGRAGETHLSRDGHGTPVRPNQFEETSAYRCRKIATNERRPIVAIEQQAVRLCGC